MSQITDQADDFGRKAIEILLNKRAAIGERLKLLNYDVASLTASPKARAYGICGSTEHNARKCPRISGEPDAVTA